MTDTDQQSHVIVFDGVCQFCNRALSFIVQRDSQARFRFVPMQSTAGQELMRSHQLDPDNPDSLLLIKNGQRYVHSDAAIEIVAELDGHWPLLRWTKLLPRSLRDSAYRLVARNRYRIFGKVQQCALPPDSVIHSDKLR